MHTIQLITHIWQSTVVGLVILGLVLLGQRLSANTRRALGWIALAKFALPAFWLTSLLVRLENLLILWLATTLPASPARWPLAFKPLTFSLKLPVSIFPSAAPAREVPTWIGFGHVAVVASLGVSAVLFSSWLARGFRLRRRILAGAAPVSPGMEQFIGLAAARMGLTSAPKCMTTLDRHGPGLVGVFSPVVVLPFALEKSLTPAELEAILIHEFTHLRRGDNLWSALQVFFLSLFWFNPVVWLLSRNISLETEKSCDDRVLEITRDPANYVGGIIKAARYSLGLPQPGFAGAASLPLVSRIESILGFGSRASRPVLRIAALAAGCLLAVLSVYAGALVEDSAGLGKSNSPGGQQPKMPQISGETRQAFLKVKHLLDAKDYDGVLAILNRLEPSVDKDSYDRAVIIDTEAKVFWQGKNIPAASIKPWEELLQLVERHPGYLEPKDRIAHLLYLAQAYYLAASGAKLKNEPLKGRYLDKSIAYMKRWRQLTPKLSQEDLLFYTTLLYQKAGETSGKVDKQYLELAKNEAEKALSFDPHCHACSDAVNHHESRE